MSDLVRFTVSIEKPLYERMQELIENERYENRSEFIRDLVRGRMVDEAWKKNEEALGAITVIYDHHQRKLSERLTDLQHRFSREIIANMHVHLERHLCGETILVRGKAKKVAELASLLRREKGVLHVSLSVSSTGKKLQ